MKVPTKWFVTAAAATIGGSVVAVSPLTANEGSITGRVRCANGHPLPYANVVVLGKKLGAITGQDGFFVIPHVPTGTQKVQSTYFVFRASTKLLTVEAGASTWVEFDLLERRLDESEILIETVCVIGSKGKLPQQKARSGQGGGGEDILAHSCCFAPIEKYAPQQVKPEAIPRFALAQNHPNPCNPATEIGFELAHRTPARLRIYDPVGRLVRLLIDETLDPGPHAIAWDGRNDHGHAVSSGVYFYRLEAADFVETRRLTVLK